jgi:hypothetical protein
VTLLRGYADVARELQNLNLPIADIKDVFLKQKIVMHPGLLKKAGGTHSTPNVKAAAAAAAEAERVRTTSAKTTFSSPGKATGASGNATSATNKPLQQLNPRIVRVTTFLALSILTCQPVLAANEQTYVLCPLLHTLMSNTLLSDNPPPCNYYYLAKCGAGANCRWGDLVA